MTLIERATIFLNLLSFGKKLGMLKVHSVSLLRSELLDFLSGDEVA